MEVKKIVEEWEIWDKEEKMAKSEKEAKKLVLQRFHKWIHVFDKKKPVKECPQENYRIM